MRVFVATASYGAIDPRSALSFVRLMTHLGSRGEWALEAFNPNQARAKNMLTQRFLKSGADRMVCIDADSVFSPEDVDAVLAVDEDIVSTLCKMKSLESDFIGVPLEGGEKRGALMEMRRMGFGLGVFTRTAVERLCADAAMFDDGVPEMFATGIINGRFTSADYVLCDRWRALGGQLWLHTGVRIGHAGTHVFA